MRDGCELRGEQLLELGDLVGEVLDLRASGGFLVLGDLGDLADQPGREGRVTAPSSAMPQAIRATATMRPVSVTGRVSP